MENSDHEIDEELTRRCAEIEADADGHRELIEEHLREQFEETLNREVQRLYKIEVEAEKAQVCERIEQRLREEFETMLGDEVEGLYQDEAYDIPGTHLAVLKEPGRYEVICAQELALSTELSVDTVDRVLNELATHLAVLKEPGQYLGQSKVPCAHELALSTELPVDTVDRVLNELEERGLITCEQRRTTP
jgi:DNA-binding transcriptional regulator YhcF (GntR family)